MVHGATVTSDMQDDARQSLASSSSELDYYLHSNGRESTNGHRIKSSTYNPASEAETSQSGYALNGDSHVLRNASNTFSPIQEEESWHEHHDRLQRDMPADINWSGANGHRHVHGSEGQNTASQYMQQPSQASAQGQPPSLHVLEPSPAINHGTASTSTASAVTPCSTGLPEQEEHLNPDALLVQKTYARIDQIGGIPRDGFVDGVELTRERRTQSSINGYLDPILAASWGPSSSNEHLRTDSAPHTRRRSEGASNGLLSVDGARYPPATDGERRRKVSAASRAASTQAPQEEAAELQFLQKVDRYGFFTPSYLSSTSGRLVLLPKEPCLDLPKKKLNSKSKGKGKVKHNDTVSLPSPYIQLPDGQSNGRGEQTRNNSPRSSLIPPSVGMSASTSMTSISSLAGQPVAQTANDVKEPLRIVKWCDEMLVPARRDQGGNVMSWKFRDDIISSENKLQRRIRKGIPDRWRLAAWEALLQRMKAKSGKGPDMTTLERRFYELILEPCEHDVQIDLDVPRTISGHLYFHTRYGLGQRALFNVLHAFALYCPDCGYCQGMGSLAATFLCYMPAENVYAAMIYLHDAYNMHSIFAPGFPGMLECFHAQEELVKLLMPDVAEVFDKNYISVSSFGTKWYITLFVNVLPFSTQLRIWDLFLYGGKDVLILTATAIIWALRQHIVHSSADFERILSMLSSYFVPADEDAFVRWVGKMLKRQDVRNALEGWKADYRKQEESRRS